MGIHEEAARGYLPGWYADPADPELQRWYDGNRWTPATHSCGCGHCWGTAPTGDYPGAAAEAERPAGPRRRKLSILSWLGIFTAALAITAMLVMGSVIAATCWALVVLALSYPNARVRVAALAAAASVVVGALIFSS